MSDETVADFIGFTGAGPDEARQYLEMAGGNLEQAVQLFMDMGTGGGAVGGGRGLGAEVPLPLPVDEEVRAPIAAFDDQMINVEAETRRVEQAMKADAAAMHHRMSFDREEPAAAGEAPAPSAGSAINELFKPPPYNEVSAFYQAVERAMSEQKWLLVNIQQADAFASHVLNRDTWRDEAVSEFVEASFVFWQRDNLSTEGAQFCKQYKCDTLPHICMVDPRTGRSVKAWKGERFAKTHVATECLFDFLDANPAPTGADRVRASSSAESATSALAAAPAPAVAAEPAPAGATAGATAEAAAAATAAEEAALGPGQALGGSPASGPSPAPEEPDGEVAEMPEEPDAGVEHVKVSLRLPTGQRVMRRFRPEDALEVVFAVGSALTSCPPDSIDISTQMPKKSLRDMEGGLSGSVKDAKIGGNMLVVETGRRPG